MKKNPCNRYKQYQYFFGAHGPLSDTNSKAEPGNCIVT